MNTGAFKQLAAFSIMLLLATLTGCAKAPQLPALAAQAKILAFGDALTAAPHLPTAQNYAGLLQKHLQRQVINAGVTGEKLAEAVQRLPTVLDAEKPDLLILMHGGYALESEQDTVKVIEAFRQMINAAKQRNIAVALIGMPENDPHLAPPPFYRKLASAFAVPYHGAVLSKVLAAPEFLSPEGLPNAAGYQIIADGIIELLQEAQAIPQEPKK